MNTSSDIYVIIVQEIRNTTKRTSGFFFAKRDQKPLSALKPYSNINLECNLCNFCLIRNGSGYTRKHTINGIIKFI